MTTQQRVRSGPLVGETASRDRVSVAGRLVGLRLVGGRSVLTVRVAGGYDREVTLAARPNLGLARNLTGGFRRLAWVRIDTTSTPVCCEVSGIARRAHRCRIPLAAALALAAADVPTLVRLRPLEV
ncbi:MAG: hypothetical protein M3535_00820 [Actinomycetota bacterium]|jgi:hypothetical protein|nr:hypothetical protein [Actinomycetota bacterium]